MAYVVEITIKHEIIQYLQIELMGKLGEGGNSQETLRSMRWLAVAMHLNSNASFSSWNLDLICYLRPHLPVD